MAVDAATRTPRLGRLERPALTGVLVREVVNFSSYWRSTTFSSTVEPTIYLLAFGFGFGSLVSRVAGLDYVQFVGTGTSVSVLGLEAADGRAPQGERRPTNLEAVFVLLTGEEID
jgi:hypothetical protein